MPSVYTPAQAAQILGMAEAQVTALIQSRALAAEFNQGLMCHMIAHDRLMDFMKSKGMFEQMRRISVSHVLLCDRDSQLQFLVRTELERGGRVSVRVATTSKDIEIALAEHSPDVLAMHIAATQRQTDNLAGLLRRARTSRPIKLILYHNEPDLIVEGREDIRRIREFLTADALISVAGGTRKLIAAIQEMLGFGRRETTSRHVRPITSAPPPAAAPPPPPGIAPGQPPIKPDTHRRTLGT